MKNKKIIIFIIIVILVLISLLFLLRNKSTTKSYEKPKEQDIKEAKKFIWKKDSLENHNMNKDIINSFNESIKTKEITSSLIIKDGVIVNEYFKDGYNENSEFPIHSCSKSITGALMGIAIDKGYIDNVDVLISNYFDEIKHGNNDLQKQITIKHLLTHTSGFISTDTSIWEDWRKSSNWTSYMFNSPMQNTPGTRFRYSTGNTHVLSALLEKVLNKNLFEFGKENLFDKMDIDSIKCETSPEGVTDGGNGYTLTEYDFAKFGLLYLNNGKWDKEELISSTWIKESTKVQVERGSLADYGYQWWIRDVGNNNYHCYYAQGFGGQFLFVVPDQNLIITFTSNYNSDDYSDMFYKYVNDISNSIVKS